MATNVSTASSLRFAALLTGVTGFLDAYTFLARGGVFANAQTGNVILLAINASRGLWWQALSHLWPILAFALGIIIATHVKTGRLDAVLIYPIRWAVALQALVLVVVGFVPGSAPPAFATVPIAFLTATQLHLFRTIGGLPYMSVATTGNLMRLIEAGYGRVVEATPQSRLAVRVYASLVTTFTAGAVLGAFVTRGLGVHAAWVAAGMLGIALVLFAVDERAAAGAAHDPGDHAE